HFSSNSVYGVALGNLLVRSGNLAAGIDHVAGLLEKDPNNPDLLYRLAEAYRRKGDLNAAGEYFRRASEAAPNDVALLLQLALIMDGTGRRDQAVQLYERLLTL